MGIRLIESFISGETALQFTLNVYEGSIDGVLTDLGVLTGVWTIVDAAYLVRAGGGQRREGARE